MTNPERRRIEAFHARQRARLAAGRKPQHIGAALILAAVLVPLVAFGAPIVIGWLR